MEGEYQYLPHGKSVPKGWELANNLQGSPHGHHAVLIKKQSVHFSSATDLWETPKDFFDKYNGKYQFTLDVCAIHGNAKCRLYFTPEQDGLAQDWKDHVCWMNPPYGREIGKWIKKAYESSLNGATVVCLLPARTDTRWWHSYCVKGEIEFIKGRIRFNGHKSGAPFPSAVVVFNPSRESDNAND